MAMTRWEPPTWAELDGEDVGRSDMDRFFDAVVERLPPGKTRGDWNAIWQRMPASLGDYAGAKAVMLLFLYNSETVFQQPIGMVVYPHVGDQLFYIAE